MPPLAILSTAVRDPGNQVGAGSIHPRFDQTVDIGRERSMGADANGARGLLASERRDHFASHLGKVGVVILGHLDHRGADDVREDPLIRLGGVRIVVTKDSSHVVVSAQQPAVVDRVMEQRLVVPQALPDRERVVEVGPGMQVFRTDRHGSTPWR